MESVCVRLNKKWVSEIFLEITHKNGDSWLTFGSKKAISILK